MLVPGRTAVGDSQVEKVTKTVKVSSRALFRLKAGLSTRMDARRDSRNWVNSKQVGACCQQTRRGLGAASMAAGVAVVDSKK